MLTKAIIMERVLNSNTYKVRIPYQEKAGFPTNTYLEAIVSHEPALIDSYNVGDVVIVGFEDHNGEKPIIIGKLLLNNDESRGAANISSIEVTNSAILPESTMVGNIDVYKTLTALKRGDNVTNDMIDNLVDSTNSGVGEAMPRIRVASLSNTNNNCSFNVNEVVNLNVVVSGNLQEGDEITLCERKNSTNTWTIHQGEPDEEDRKRKRYRYYVLTKINITESSSGNHQVFNISLKNIGTPTTIEEKKMKRIYSHNNRRGKGPIIRYIRVRRMVNNANDALFSNIFPIEICYNETNHKLSIH